MAVGGAPVTPVDKSGNVLGTASNPLVTSGGSGGSAGQVQGTAASGSAVSGNPVRVAGQARTSNLAAVGNGTAVDMVATAVGVAIEKPFSIPEADWSYVAAAGGITNSTTAVTIKAAAGAGLRNYITGMQITCDPLATASEFVIRDGAAGTVIWRTKFNTSGTTGIEQVTFPSPIKSTANTLLEMAMLTAAATGSVFVNAQGYVAP